MTYLTDFYILTLSDLQEFVARGKEQNLHLDFKLVKDTTFSSRDDKRNLACALSGFANSSGGLIVWGVDARKNANGVDCAVELKPVVQVALLIARLNSLIGEASDPSIERVRHRAIELEDGRELAVTVVPESDSGPHMAKLGENRYYERIGDGFYSREHYDIADMFGRRKKPKLTVFNRAAGKRLQAEVHLGLRNDGRATTRAPYFAFESEGPLARRPYGLGGNESLLLLKTPQLGLRGLMEAEWTLPSTRRQ